MNAIEKGGLHFHDFTTVNNTFKINWIKNCINKLIYMEFVNLRWRLSITNTYKLPSFSSGD